GQHARAPVTALRGARIPRVQRSSRRRRHGPHSHSVAGRGGGAIRVVIRVAIVDDEPMAREGLRLWLATEPDMSVIGEAGTPATAIALVIRERPDLLFLDVQ